ncbi:MAG: hypothetical protein ACTSSP_11595 [Candidatus Asgardarchaeia archaeon]
MALTDIKISINGKVEFFEDERTQEMIKYYGRGEIPHDVMLEYMRLRTTLGSIIVPYGSSIMWEWEPIESRFEILDL